MIEALYLIFALLLAALVFAINPAKVSPSCSGETFYRPKWFVTLTQSLTVAMGFVAAGIYGSFSIPPTGVAVIIVHALLLAFILIAAFAAASFKAFRIFVSADTLTVGGHFQARSIPLESIEDTAITPYGRDGRRLYLFGRDGKRLLAIDSPLTGFDDLASLLGHTQRPRT